MLDESFSLDFQVADFNIPNNPVAFSEDFNSDFEIVQPVLVGLDLGLAKDDFAIFEYLA